MLHCNIGTTQQTFGNSFAFMYLYILMLHISGVQYALSHHLFSRGVTELVKRALCRFGNEIQTHRPV